ncbi:MAG: guanine deaminase [Rhodospirillales bacterium]|jgi:guanine deaminase|nr:guanine deaminase [Rhodospirillales bacterium]MBT4041766.1 guanine deaminase [Rhodospirillales bacterium]MBT4626068.1 guanine deaminase [Rhodospirillales bacterium]MBT5353430.1 guanine deaminase [Rhodospirillales bacterium]MBT5521552.1 guanine deaminase [Rhodospirillales bacterium]
MNNTNSNEEVLRGQTLSFRDDPFACDPDAAIDFHSDGAVWIVDGVIKQVGAARDVLDAAPDVPVRNYGDALIMAGFVDCHAHYPQTAIIASYGEQLLDWLKQYTFPEEMRFVDGEYARRQADLYLDECLRNGITTSSVYCSVHPQSADSFFEASNARGLRMAAGKVLMDRHAPDGLTDTATTGYDQSKALIERWHGVGRNMYAITPRFAPTSTPEQLEAAGTLWREYPDVLMQTHASENANEIQWVKELFPSAPDYMGVYENYGLVGPGAIYGHAIHLNEREQELFRDSGAAMAHCPTSNLFIGSGLFDLQSMRESDRPVTVGLATDVSGGSSFSMFSTMRTAYEIAQLRGYSLHPVRAYYLATLGSAATMRIDDKVGNLAAGYEADLVVLDLSSRPLIAQRMKRSESITDVLFTQMILADDRATIATYANGSIVYERAI